MTTPTSAQRQFLVSVAGISVGYWSSKSGGGVEADTSDVYNGGDLNPEKLASPATTSNVTLGRPYSVVRDDPIWHRLAKLCGRWRTSVTVQPTDENLTPMGQPTVYPDALLVRCEPPEHDASSGDASMFELEFAPPRIA